MADEKQSGGNSLIVLVVAAVSAAYFAWQKPQLEGFRPVETLHQAHDSRGRQDVEARLWQDPLAAVKDQFEGEKKDGPATDQDHSIKISAHLYPVRTVRTSRTEWYCRVDIVAQRRCHGRKWKAD